MRHKRRSRLSGTCAHRQAKTAGLLAALLEHGRIKTTERKARELRRVAEQTITRAKRLGDLLSKERDTLTAAERARLVHAVRMVRRTVRRKDATQWVFDRWAPQFLGRPGGYTRLTKMSLRRKGDNAPMAILEFMGEGLGATPASSE